MIFILNDQEEIHPRHGNLQQQYPFYCDFCPVLLLPVNSKTKSPDDMQAYFFPCCAFYECHLQLTCGSSHVAAVTALLEAPEPPLVCAEHSQLSQPHSSLYQALQKTHQSEQRAGIISLDLLVMLLLMYCIYLC